MAIIAELHDGTELEFPDGTDPTVIQSTVRKMMGQARQSAPVQQPAPVAQPQGETSFLDDALNLGGAAVKGLGGSFNSLGQAANVLLGAVPTVYDKAKSAITGTPTTAASDAWFGAMVDPIARNQHYFEPTQNAGLGEQVAHAGGGAAGLISQAILSGGGNVEPVISDAVRAVPAAIDAIRALATKGMGSMFVPAAGAGVNAATNVLQNGGNNQQATQAGLANFLMNEAVGVTPMGATGGIVKRAVTGGATMPVVMAGLNDAIVNPNMPQQMRHKNFIEQGQAVYNKTGDLGEAISAGARAAAPDAILGAMMHGAMGHPNSGPVMPTILPSRGDRQFLNPQGVAREDVAATMDAARQGDMSVADFIQQNISKANPNVDPDVNRQNIAAEAEARANRAKELNETFGPFDNGKEVDTSSAYPQLKPSAPASKEEAVRQAYTEAGIDPAAAENAFARARAQEQMDLPPSRARVAQDDVSRRTTTNPLGDVVQIGEARRSAATPEQMGERERVAREIGLTPEEAKQVSDITGLSVEDIGRLSFEGQNRLKRSYLAERPQMETLRTSFEGSPDGNITSPASKPNAVGDRMGEKYGVTEEGAGEVREARRDFDYTNDVNAQNNALRERLINNLGPMRQNRDALGRQIADIQREIDTGRQLSEKEGNAFASMKASHAKASEEIRRVETKIYDLERTTSAGSKQASGTSDRPFKMGDESPETIAAAKAKAEATTAEAQRRQHEDLMREWEARENARKERERQHQQSEEDQKRSQWNEYYSQQSRRARSEQAKNTGQKSAEGFSEKAAPYNEKDGTWQTDQFGFVRSDKGGPVKFKDQKAAGWFILRTLNKAAGVRQAFDIANHPSGDGFTAQVRHVNEPPPKQGRTWEGGTQLPPPKAEPAPKSEPDGGVSDQKAKSEPAPEPKVEPAPKAEQTPPSSEQKQLSPDDPAFAEHGDGVTAYYTDAQVNRMYNLAKLKGAKTVEQKRAELDKLANENFDKWDEIQSKIESEVPLDEGARFDKAEDWNYGKAENFPEGKETVDASKSAGKDYIAPEVAKKTIDSWKAEAKRMGKEMDNSNRVIISLFDASGVVSKPWREAGFEVLQFDAKLGHDLLTRPPIAEIHEMLNAGMEIAGIIAQPPCTTFTSTGARWHETKHDAHDRALVQKMFGDEAAKWFSKPHEYSKALVSIVDMLVGEAKPKFFVLENPNGGAGPTRIKSDAGLPQETMIFQPHNYGDPYTKKTLLWGDFNTDLPTANVDPTQGSLMHKMWSTAEASGGKRSLTPEGFAYALFMANKGRAIGESKPAPESARDSQAPLDSQRREVTQQDRDNIAEAARIWREIGDERQAQAAENALAKAEGSAEPGQKIQPGQFFDSVAALRMASQAKEREAVKNRTAEPIEPKKTTEVEQANALDAEGDYFRRAPASLRKMVVDLYNKTAEKFAAQGIDISDQKLNYGTVGHEAMREISAARSAVDTLAFLMKKIDGRDLGYKRYKPEQVDKAVAIVAERLGIEPDAVRQALDEGYTKKKDYSREDWDAEQLQTHEFYEQQRAEAAQKGTAPKPKPDKNAPKRQKEAPRSDLLAQLKKAGGVAPELARDAGGDSGQALNRNLPGSVKRTGMRDYDDVAEWLLNNGWIHDATYYRDGTVSAEAVEQAQDLLSRALRGERVEHPETQISRAEYDSAAADTPPMEAMKAESLNVNEPDIRNAVTMMADIKAIRGDAYYNSDLMPRLKALKDGGDRAAIYELINKEHENATREQESGSQAGEGRGEAQRADNPEGTEGAGERFNLQSQSAADLRAEDQRRQSAERESERNSRELEQKQQADSERGNFTLTGSDRAADANPNQGDMFGNSKRDIELKQMRDIYGNDTLDLNMLGNTKLLTKAVNSALHFMFGDKSEIIQHWNNVAKDLRGIRDGVPSPHGSHLERIARWALDTSHGSIRALANKYDSPALHRVIDQFQVETGNRDRVAGKTFDRAVNEWTNEQLTRLQEGIGKLQDNQQAMAQIAAKVRSGNYGGSSAVDKAASTIASVLKDSLNYMREAGVEVGEVKQGYLPRELDSMEVMKDTNGFIQAATAEYRKNGHPNPKAAAEALADVIMYGDQSAMFRAPAGQVRTPFTEGRVWSKDVDNPSNPLHKYLEKDTMSSLIQYVQRASRRAEIARRFGDKFSHWDSDYVDANGKQQKAILRQIEAEGGRDAIPALKDFISLAAGLRNPGMTAGEVRFSSALRTWGSMMFLDKATLSSLTEFITPAIRAGGGDKSPLAVPANIFRSLHATMADLAAYATKSATALERRAFAQDLGYIATTLSDTFVANRFSGGEPASKFESRALDNYFKRTGLTYWTDATRVASVEIGRTYIRRLMKQVKEGDRLSREFLNELGVEKGTEQQFADSFLRHNDGRPDSVQIRASGKMGEVYRTALGRFLEQSIMSPNRSIRPKWAASPFGSIVAQLQSYNYAFYENVLKRTGSMAYDAGNLKNDYKMMERLRLLQPLATIPTLIGMAFIIGEGRDELFGDPVHRKKETDGQKFLKAASRGAPIAPIDPFINYMSAARYRRSAAESFAGPVIGKASQGADALRGMVADTNSKKTNSAERQLAKNVYDLVIEPTVNLGLSVALPASFGTAAATQFVGSGRTREMFVGAIAGPDKRTGKSYRE